MIPYCVGQHFPIETAPRDGTLIHAWGDYLGLYPYHAAYDTKAQRWGWPLKDGGVLTFSPQPTRWMPCSCKDWRDHWRRLEQSMEPSDEA